MRVKVCGITRAEHGIAAARLGADFLGFIFVPGTRRYLAPDVAQRVIAEIRSTLVDVSTPALVGLFVNESAAEVNRVAKLCGLDYAQFCGEETPEYCQQIERTVFRSLRPCSRADLARFDEFASVAHRLVLDTYHPGAFGGTGCAGDWGLAAEAAARHPLILAGGLTPENVAAGIAAVRPWGVDVSSGVETDGVKDVAKIARFISEAKSAIDGERPANSHQ